MWTGAAAITASCVLFIGMGLDAEIERLLSCRFKVLSCPKCLTFWSVLLFGLCNRHGWLEVVAVSFLSSYAALWLTLLCDALTTIYNRLYETITKQPEGASGEPTAANGQDAAATDSQVPEMHVTK